LLGAVSCVAGIVTASSGCSSTETTVTANDAASDAPKDRVVPEAAPDEEAGTCYDATKAPTTASIDKDIGTYKAGAITPGKCTTEDLTQFAANLKDSSLMNWSDLNTKLSADCAACVVTKDSDATWGPIVYYEDGSGFTNFGSCFGAVEKNDACGKAIQYAEFCYNAACDACTADADNTACVKTAGAMGGACESFAKDVDTNCKSVSTDANKCLNASTMAKTLCGGTISDAGGDGDADM